MTMTEEALAVLRKPFDPQVVGKLPRVTCKDCSQRKCQQHKASKCGVCGGYLTSAHIHLDYVGHAEVTDRLLSADPAWTWEPLSWTEEGLPRFTKGASGELELWIKLTVCGVTRLGVGSVAGNAFDAEKQLIGDALRNAAMRFGVALDLWAKEELESQLPDDADAKPQRADAAKKAAPAAPAPQDRAGGERQVSASPAAPSRTSDEVPPSTGPKRRKPPLAAPSPLADPPLVDDEATAPQRKAIADAIERLIPKDRSEVMRKWHEGNLPPFYVSGTRDPNPEFTTVHAAKALSILAEFKPASEAPFTDDPAAA